MAAGLTAVVDYGLCNTDSMVRALEECGATEVVRTRDPCVIHRADRIVLPGVGNFSAAMRNMESYGLVDIIREAGNTGSVPVLGACLGMQLMATSGSEGARNGIVAGLGIVAGEVAQLTPMNDGERIPHIGWNDVDARRGSALFRSLAERTDFYFVHSYHLRLANPNDEAGRTSYCGGFTAAIEVAGRPIFGTQFHPEKSQKNGFQLLRNFLAV